jgi:hypothetical protein
MRKLIIKFIKKQKKDSNKKKKLIIKKIFILFREIDCTIAERTI